ncbi:Amidase domain-containing protein [Meloidogyne graminicola]|uniref:Amidase domain-containing protein n=1 Tax=Meloidogyne graminicola TaxID=189291 RepID=A0A8T0A001_9BILA|nr:Amidase domain-containing protein [Meloidogyne graminicola]
MNIALERIRASTTRAKELRHLNFIITETFDLAEKHCEEAVQNGKQPFEVIVKDNFANRINMYNGCFGPVKHSIYANKQLNNELEDDFVIAGGSSGGCAVAVAIGVAKYERNNLLSKDAENSYLNALNLLSSKGVKIKEVNIPHLDFAINCYSIIVDVEVASNMARFDGIRYGYCSKEHLINDDSFISYITRNRTESLGNSVKRRIFSGNFYSLQENYNKYVNKAAKIQRLLQKDFNTAFTNNNLHCILTPVSRHSAPLFSQIKKRSREEQRLDDYFMAPTNLCETGGIRCFCDKKTCGGGALVCAGKYCLIGLYNDDESGSSRLEQHCIDEQLYSNKIIGCEKEWQKWSEVCICEENLCNTFAFLRSQLDGNFEEQQRLIVSDYSDSSVLNRWKETRGGRDSNDNNDENGPNTMRRWMTERENRQPQGRGANLVLLLVVLPLAVGAFTGDKTNAPTPPSSLAIFIELKQDENCSQKNHLLPPAFIQVGTWVYPLRGPQLTTIMKNEFEKGEEYRANLEPTEEPTNIHPLIQNGVVILHKGSKIVAKVTRFVLNKIGDVGVVIGHKISESLSGDGTGGKTFRSTATVLGGGITAVATVLISLEEASKTLLKCISDETVQIVNLRYGSEASQTTHHALHALGHSTLAGFQIFELGHRSIAGRMARRAGIQIVQDFSKSEEVLVSTKIVNINKKEDSIQ